MKPNRNIEEDNFITSIYDIVSKQSQKCQLCQLPFVEDDKGALLKVTQLKNGSESPALKVCKDCGSSIVRHIYSLLND